MHVSPVPDVRHHTIVLAHSLRLSDTAVVILLLVKLPQLYCGHDQRVRAKMGKVTSKALNWQCPAILFGGVDSNALAGYLK